MFFGRFVDSMVHIQDAIGCTCSGDHAWYVFRRLRLIHISTVNDTFVSPPVEVFPAYGVPGSFPCAPVGCKRVRSRSSVVPQKRLRFFTVIDLHQPACIRFFQVFSVRPTSQFFRLLDRHRIMINRSATIPFHCSIYVLLIKFYVSNYFLSCSCCCLFPLLIRSAGS
jgi:hypothetical protein